MTSGRTFVPESVADPSVTSPKGFRAGAASAGVKEGTNRLDLALVVADRPCVAHAIFTRCRVVGATVLVSRERIRSGRAQGIVINSGNANACTGQDGLLAAESMASTAAEHMGIDPSLMLVASTGVIGVPFPIDRVVAGIPRIKPTADGGHDAARAIMTTDLVPKESARTVEIGGRRITVAGMAKGSGMIHPDMATLISVITTDARLEPGMARLALKRAADASFNQVSVDRDTSPDDTLALLANGAAGGDPIQSGTVEARIFQGALDAVCIELARMIARDGEGATRLIQVDVEGATTLRAGRRVAREVIASNLVKTAIYGRDPNWGRILSAVGNAGVPIDPDRVDIFIGEQQVAAKGAFHPFDARVVSEAMGADEVRIRVNLNQGRASGCAWGCDLTEGYVKINAEYTT
ncbi:MAG: bifunctional glutamate N-acetyltransferase/amino-acid acetyltransferase ArgJ [Chloroflexi bacterium]|nr:bifunctional glutamate N-acetyltransferase/amino-acid acetyltransferase ArgJ [Chloroflexota bacterium]